MERPAPPLHRSWRTSQRVLITVLTLAFGVLGLVVLLAGAEAGVRAWHGRADLWLEAAAATAPNVGDLAPGLSSEGYDLVHVRVTGAESSSMVLYALTLALGTVVFAGICFFLAYLCHRIHLGKPFDRVLTVGLTASSVSLVALSLLGPFLFAAAQGRIFADLGVELGRAPFVNGWSFGDADAVLLVAGVFLGLLALAFRAGGWCQRAELARA
ncbi:hypothetical protein ACT4S2_04095 [Kocuria turfanensis]|uniref:hypothetical protein n=1 Tax=Kocuria turfanensis TaxID=388357 RepID=UPI0040352FAD